MTTERIGPFQGKYRFLSNFWLVDIKANDGLTYSSVEHAYQAYKFIKMSERKIIRDCPTPGEAKRYARSMTLRSDWETVKTNVMALMVHLKFQHSILKEKLLNTGDAEIVEINAWGDKFWGECDGEGENHLGKILMTVREQLRKEEV